MSVTVSATKKISFKLPYTGKTFQQQAQSLIGRDGYISGGAASDDGTTIELEACTFVQRGIIATSAAVTGGLSAPTAAEPWFVLAAIPDDHPDSGVVFSATADLGAAAAGLVVAFKTNGRWQNPVGVDVAGAARRSGEVGVETGLGIAENEDVSTFEVDSLSVRKGTLVDIMGERRELLPEDPATNAAIAREVATTRPHATRYRTDYLVLRQPEAHTPEIVLAMGPTHAGSIAAAPTTLATPAVPAKRAGYHARRGGTDGQQWWAWGDAAALKVKVGTGVAWLAHATLLFGAGNINETWVAGQRAADSRVVILYVDGLVLRMVSINETTGAQVDAPVTIANTGAQISRVRAVLDRNEVLHFVFENDEASQQIYYGTCSIASASFGTVGIAPSYARGAASATNDTWPSIGVDRKGNVTIAFIQGTGANEYGDLVVVTRDSAGEIVSTIENQAANDVAIDSGGFSVGGSGFEPTAFLNFRRTAVVVTPYDEVYALTVGLESGVDPAYVLIYNAEFEAKHGRSVVNAMPALTSLASGPITGLAAACGEQGEIVAVVKVVVGGNGTHLHVVTLNPRPCDLGADDSVAYIGNSRVSGLETSGFTDLLLSRGPRGGYQLNYVFGADVRTVDLASASGSGVLGLAFGGGALKPHPRDVQLGGVVVPPGNTLPEANKPAFEVFHTRPKKMNFPFLVGNRGDYQGHGSLHQAAIEAARVNGEIVVRNGHHVLKDGPLRLKSRIRGEGRSVILMSGDSQTVYLGDQALGVAYTAVGNVLSSNMNFFFDLYPGCVVDAVPGAGPDNRHHVLRRMGFDSVAGETRVLVGNAVGVVPGAGAADIYWGGLAIEDLTFGSLQGNPMVKIENGFKPVMRNVSVMGDLGMRVEIVKCLQPLLDNIDFTDLDNGTDPLLVLDSNEYAVCRDVRVTGGQGVIQVLAGNLQPMFINCGNEDESLADPVFDLESNALMLSCTGRRTGSAAAYTMLNAPVLVDNTYGTDDRALIQLTGAPEQYAPLVNMKGVWGAELGFQAFIDSTGEPDVRGDHITEDFHSLTPGLWSIVLKEDGHAKTPSDGEAEHGYAPSAFVLTSGSATLVGIESAPGWTIDATNTLLQAPLTHLKPGDTITTITWSTHNVGAAGWKFYLVRQELGVAGSSVAIVDEDTFAQVAGDVAQEVTYDHEVEDGFAYSVAVLLQPGSTLIDGALNKIRFLGAMVHHTRPDMIGTTHDDHAVELSLGSVDTLTSRSELKTRYSIGKWTDKPLLRMRVKIGDLTDTALIHVFGLGRPDFVGNTGLSVAFAHDPGNASGFGASNEIRFCIFDGSALTTTVLTGFTPTANTYYWFWIGWKSANEAFWGISTDLASGFIANGSLAIAGAVDASDLSAFCSLFNHVTSAGAPDTNLTVDAVRYRSSTRSAT